MAFIASIIIHVSKQSHSKAGGEERGVGQDLSLSESLAFNHGREIFPQNSPVNTPMSYWPILN